MLSSSQLLAVMTCLAALALAPNAARAAGREPVRRDDDRREERGRGSDQARKADPLARELKPGEDARVDPAKGLGRLADARGSALAPGREADGDRVAALDPRHGHEPTKSRAADLDFVPGGRYPTSAQGWAELGGRPRIELPADASLLTRVATLFREAGRTVMANGGALGTAGKMAKAVVLKGPLLFTGASPERVREVNRQLGAKFEEPTQSIGGRTPGTPEGHKIFRRQMEQLQQRQALTDEKPYPFQMPTPGPVLPATDTNH